MSNHRIADLRPRIASLDEAKAVAQNITQALCRLEVEKAKLERAITDLKAKSADRMDSLALLISEFESDLKRYISANRHLFKDPRKIQTDFASFGLQTVSDLQIDNEPALVDYVLEAGYEDCLKTVRTPVKAAIKKRITAGEEIPGCRLITGDTAVFKPVRALLDAAREEVL